MSKKVFYGLTLLTRQQSGHSVHSAVVKIRSTSHTDITVITLRHSLWCLLERLLWTLWCIVNTVVLGAEMKHFKTVNNELHKKKPWCQYFLLNKGSVHLCWYDNEYPVFMARTCSHTPCHFYVGRVYIKLPGTQPRSIFVYIHVGLSLEVFIYR